MKHLLDIVKRIDLQGLSGIRRMLGVDLTDDMVRVVELQKQGGVLNKYAPRIEATKAYYRRFSDGASLEEKAQEIRELLLSCGITTTHAVSSVRTLGVKTLTVGVPASVVNLDEWIRENYERLLRIPLPLNQLSYGFEVIESGDAETRVEITFVRNADVERYCLFFSKAGLTLIALGAGTRDAINGIVMSDSQQHAERFILAHVDAPVLSMTYLHNGTREDIRQIVVQNGQDVLKAIANTQSEIRNQGVRVCIAGTIDNAIETSEHMLAEPFGLRSEYALAAGLAAKGFLPEMSPTSFLPDSEKESVSASLYKSLTNRVALALGSILVLLLGLQLLAASFIQSRVEKLEDLASAGPEYMALSVLQRDVESLQRKLNGKAPHGTSIARTIHELASATPANVWMYRLKLTNDAGRQPTISLFGYASSNEHITDFLKRLQVVCSDANLVRSSLPLQSETMVPVTGGRSPMMTFEIKAVGKD